MSTSLPLVSVVGSTGTQGGSVVRALIQSGKFKVRGLTRDPSSSSANELTKLGVEMVKADLNDIESLKKAFTGAYAVFGVTNTYDKEILWAQDFQKEFQQGKNMGDAAQAVGVKYFVWSSLPNTKTISKGKYTDVYHFHIKAEVEEYLRKNTKLSNFFAPGGKPQKDDKGVYVFRQPMVRDAKLAWYSASKDTGKVVAHLLNSPDEYAGKRIAAFSEEGTPQDFAKEFTKATGKEARYEQLKDEDFLKYLPPPLNTELLRMYQFFNDYGYLTNDDQSHVSALSIGVKGLTTFQQFVQENQDKFL